MYILGITGSIGSGKTTVSNILRNLGAQVSHSDDLAKELIGSDPELKQLISNQFGPEVYSAQGELIPSELAQRAFGSPETQSKLNAIVHPAVRQATRSRIEQARDQGVPLFIIDAPLLFEAGADQLADSVLVVASQQSTRQLRVNARSGIDEDEFFRRDRLQLPIEEKIKRSQHVIWNDGDLLALTNAATEFYKSLRL